MERDWEYWLAKRRVRSLRGFYIHRLVFVAAIILLIVVNIASGRAWWVQWVFFGWGIGLAVHAAAVFGLAGWLGPEWEEQKIRELLARRSGH